MEVSSYAPSFGAFGRYNFNGHIAAKVHFYKGILQGSDYKSQITKGERARNLSFKTDIYEVASISLVFEFQISSVQLRKEIGQ